MRLDKYLKISRLIKRRTMAKEASNNERILVNGVVAKPSKEIKQRKKSIEGAYKRTETGVQP